MTTTVDLSAIYAEHKAGAGFPELGKKYGIDPNTLRNKIKAAGYTVADRSTSKRVRADARADQIVAMWDEELSIPEIAEALDFDPKTVRKRLVEAGKYDPQRDKYRVGKMPSIIEFIAIWQESATIAEVIERVGPPADAKYVCRRAAQYRRKGIPLKLYQRGGGGYDWAELAEFAELFLEATP